MAVNPRVASCLSLFLNTALRKKEVSPLVGTLPYRDDAAQLGGLESQLTGTDDDLGRVGPRVQPHLGDALFRNLLHHPDPHRRLNVERGEIDPAGDVQHGAVGRNTLDFTLARMNRNHRVAPSREGPKRLIAELLAVIRRADHGDGLRHDDPTPIRRESAEKLYPGRRCAHASCTVTE